MKTVETDAEAVRAGYLPEGLHCLPAKLEILPDGDGERALSPAGREIRQIRDDRGGGRR
jgi:hypothetical protein